VTRGRFITLEGIDGAGKSSHLGYLRALCEARGAAVEMTREPGGTPLGEALRRVVLEAAMDPATEALLMFAARRAHVVAVIEPALAAGRWVVCDRFSDSTYAYQCGGRGLAPAVVAALEKIAHPDLAPDATFLFDIDPRLASQRQRGRDRAPDRFEREQEDFFRRVRDAYRKRADAEPQRIHVIDAARPLEDVREQLAQAFERVCA
jgi:dTMP kinase